MGMVVMMDEMCPQAVGDGARLSRGGGGGFPFGAGNLKCLVITETSRFSWITYVKLRYPPGSCQLNVTDPITIYIIL